MHILLSTLKFESVLFYSLDFKLLGTFPKGFLGSKSRNFRTNFRNDSIGRQFNSLFLADMKVIQI